LRRLEQNGNHNPEEVEALKKQMIIKKSLEQVKMRAKELEEIRNSPNRYKKVTSVVQRNLNV
jgi:hypothetical protein